MGETALLFSPVVLLPSYNNGGTLQDILERVVALGLPIVLVNDGSNDSTPQILGDWESRTHGRQLHILTHARNRGKAAALKTGFGFALGAGYTHAVTIDTDGQLDPEQIPSLLVAAERNPEALIVGSRDAAAAGYPARSRFGRRFSNTLIFLESGVRIDDSQCGLRVYPLALIQAIPSKYNRFNFETEIITRAGWARCRVVSVPVRCHYLPPGQRVSHFRPFLDSVRSLRMHARLLTRALLPLSHPKWPDVRPSGSHTPVGLGRIYPSDPSASPIRNIFSWFSPRRAWQQLRQDNVTRASLSAGLAVGAFIANLPIYGFQSIFSLYTARRLHLHPLAVLLGSQLSTPPINALLAAGAIAVGNILLHGRLPSRLDYDLSHGLAPALRSLFTHFFLEWTVGAVLLGLLCAIATFLISSALLHLLPHADPTGAQSPPDPQLATSN
jgi:uncharacterized protein (DUF2062 family)